MNKQAGKEATNPGFPLLPRPKIIKGLYQLNTDDLKTLMMMWIKSSLQNEALKNKREFKKEDLEHHIQRLDKDLKRLVKRSCIVNWLDEYLDSKLNPIQQAQLELSNVLRNPKRIRWTVYHLLQLPSKDANTHGFGEHHKTLIITLSKSLSIYFPTIVYAAKDEGLVWIRIAINTGPEKDTYPKAYIVYRPSTSFFVMNPVPANVRPYLFQVSPSENIGLHTLRLSVKCLDLVQSNKSHCQALFPANFLN
ncbi:hypothetical protein DSO57_1020967 [Entomophthora muscae]|uniref:Uncharacterized protein n=1 Tax=Entomophthora muscae TaxID=34485 RepID=A0ACC2TF41_9FUNG|nr:hypothetical protein DSO57_1020967 [Entomophthora muscae]